MEAQIIRSCAIRHGRMGAIDWPLIASVPSCHKCTTASRSSWRHSGACARKDSPIGISRWAMAPGNVVRRRRTNKIAQRRRSRRAPRMPGEHWGTTLCLPPIRASLLENNSTVGEPPAVPARRALQRQRRGGADQPADRQVGSIRLRAGRRWQAAPGQAGGAVELWRHRGRLQGGEACHRGELRLRRSRPPPDPRRQRHGHRPRHVRAACLRSRARPAGEGAALPVEAIWTCRRRSHGPRWTSPTRRIPSASAAAARRDAAFGRPSRRGPRLFVG